MFIWETECLRQGLQFSTSTEHLLCVRHWRFRDESALVPGEERDPGQCTWRLDIGFLCLFHMRNLTQNKREHLTRRSWSTY